jgi:hypothetical protein
MAAPTGPARPPLLRREQVIGPWRRIGKGQRCLLDLLIRCGQAASVLALVLLPRADAEELDEAVRSVGVPVQLPPGCACPASRPTEVLHRLQELRLPLWRNGEVDGDQDRPGVGFRVEGQSRFGPINRRLTVELPRVREPPEQSDDGPGAYEASR